MLERKPKVLGLMIGVALGVCVALPVKVNAASLTDIVNNIYGSFTSSGGTVASTNDGRVAFMGGAASLRFNPKQIRAVNFSAPSASVSCGGIDFFAGSFSMMSKDELIAAGRNIAAGATVYAFRLALNSVCASCNSIMTSIQNIMNRINELATTSCEDTVAALSQVYDPEKAKELPTNSVMNSVSNGLKNVEGILGAGDASKGENWLEWLKNSGKTVDEVALEDKQFAELQADIGFNIAFNTEAPMYLVPWLITGDYKRGTPSNNIMAKSVVWNLLTKTVECANDTDIEAERCGLKFREKVQWNMYDLIYGGASDNDSGNRVSFNYEYCNAVVHHNGSQVSNVAESSMNASTRVVCDYANETYLQTNAVQAIGPQILKDFFGVNAIDSDSNKPPAVKPNQVCDPTDKIIASNNGSAFNKLFLTNASPFTPQQNFLVKLMGPEYTYDLYKINSRGNYVTDENEATFSCSHAFERANTRLLQVFKQLEDGVLPGFERAIQAINSDPRLSSTVKPQYIKRIMELADSTRKSFRERKVASANNGG